MNWVKLFFSFRGRVNRAEYWVVSLTWFVLAAVVLIDPTPAPSEPSGADTIRGLRLAGPGTALSRVKRLVVNVARAAEDCSLPVSGADAQRAAVKIV
jgi:hypothetical protein